MIFFLFEDAIDCSQELQVADLQTCFLEELACRAGLEGLAEFKVPAR